MTDEEKIEQGAEEYAQAMRLLTGDFGRLAADYFKAGVKWRDQNPPRKESYIQSLKDYLKKWSNK